MADDSTFIAHTPCEECGSSDANAQYTDGHTYCFSCGEHKGATQVETQAPSSPKKSGQLERFSPDDSIEGLPSRNITAETCEFFGYRRGYLDGERIQFAPYYSPDGHLAGAKTRNKQKEFKWIGEVKPTGCLPFGAQRFPRTGKQLVVTEGEIDAMSMSQLQGNKWPVVSIASGAGKQVKKYIASQMEYLNGFEKIILMFDQDEAGRIAATMAAEVIGPRAHIATFALKDANEMMLAGEGEALITAMWRAKQYRPAGIVDLKDLYNDVLQAPEVGAPWPWESLTRMTFGRRLGEAYALGAGTGIGKTDVFTQIVAQTVTELNEPVGCFFLEQQPAESGRRIVGKVVGKRFHLPPAEGGWSEAELVNAWAKVMQSGKVFLYDSFGINDWDVIKERIRYLAHAHDVKHFFLDHLTALAAWQSDERKALEVIMAEIGSLVKELHVTLYFISHLATPDGKPHEEGGRVTIRHLKGSRSIGFWCHFIFGLERDQQADDMRERHTTTFRVLKDRYTGQATGQKFYLGYDTDTGLLYETCEPGEGAMFADETVEAGHATDF
jgi:twinkle protein